MKPEKDRVEELITGAPPDPFIGELADRIATQEIVLHRIQRSLTAAHTELNIQTIDNTWGKTEPFPEDPETIDEIGTAVLGKTASADAAGANTFGTITRYYVEHERIWNRAVKQYNQIREATARYPNPGTGPTIIADNTKPPREAPRIPNGAANEVSCQSGREASGVTSAKPGVEHGAPAPWFLSHTQAALARAQPKNTPLAEGVP